jgi:hypothetical protein
VSDGWCYIILLAARLQPGSGSRGGWGFGGCGRWFGLGSVRLVIRGGSVDENLGLERRQRCFLVFWCWVLALQKKCRVIQALLNDILDLCCFTWRVGCVLGGWSMDEGASKLSCEVKVLE